MKVIVGVVILWVGVALGFVFYVNETYYKRPFGNGSNQVVFSVASGDSFLGICKRLETKKLIQHPTVLSFVARFYGLRGKVRTGEYALNDGMSPQEILLVLTSGKSIIYPFTITEGMNSFDVANLFEKKGYGNREEFLQACANPSMITELLGEPVNHCEGYLFPDTYNFERKTTAKQMITRMVQSFLRAYEEVAEGRTVGKWNRHQILTFASLIEKETGAADERPLIASVFFNRLQQKIKLQTDPTIQYGILAATGVYPSNITKKDLLTPTPYNTYTNEGLPPGPIANPGKESLRAVFQPTKSEYLFFVSRNDGTHVFSKNYDEHRKAVQSFQVDPRAREGKSWRDLKKRQ